jgi:glycine cleavage system transcriptional repressor
MPKQYVISVMARDRVGIIADVTTAIQELDGNLADMSQTVLRGYFTMILIASFPDHLGPEDIRSALKAAAGGSSFEIGIALPGDELPSESPGVGERQYVLTAVGPDRIGLVAAVSGYLREKDINIADLSTTVDNGIYTMMLLVELPAGADVAKLKHGLQVAMEDVALSVELRHHAIFRMTNEI